MNVRVTDLYCSGCGEHFDAWLGGSDKEQPLPAVVDVELVKTVVELFVHLGGCGGKMIVSTEPVEETSG